MILLDVFRQNPALYFIGIILLGLIVGSFLNVVIHRLPMMMKHQWRKDCCALLTETGDLPNTPNIENQTFNLITPRSRCSSCGQPITALENIPILSFVLLKGRCASCHTKIAWRYPFVEGLSAVLIVAVAWRFGVTLQAGTAMLFTWALIALSFIDFDHQILPDEITLPFLWGGLLLSMFNIFIDLESALIGAVAGYLALWTVYQIFKRLTGKEGMGYGDFKLLAMLGAWLGWQVLPGTIIISSVVGAVVGILLILLRRHDKNIPIPFGPYLAIAGWIMLMWGNEINHAYLRWLG